MHHSAQLQTQRRGDETRRIMTDRHQGHSALPYRPTPRYFIPKNRACGNSGQLFFCFFSPFLPSWAPDGVWAPVQLHRLHRRYLRHCLQGRPVFSCTGTAVTAADTSRTSSSVGARAPEHPRDRRSYTLGCRARFIFFFVGSGAPQAAGARFN